MDGENTWFLQSKKISLLLTMQFMNSSLDSLVESWLNNYFKHLSQEFSGEQISVFIRIYGQC